MKTVLWSGLIAVGLTLTVGEVRAGMMQGPAGGSQQQLSSPQQFTMPSREMVAPRSLGGAEPAFTGQDRRPVARPSPVVAADQPNHGFIRPQLVHNQNQFGHRGVPVSVSRFGRGRDFDHDGFHHHGSRFIIVYVNGFPCWYPVYTAYPYYNYLPAPIYDNAYYGYDSSYVPPVVAGSGDTTPYDSNSAQAAPNYNELGTAWGQDLRREIVTWDQFVAYLKAYSVTAPPAGQADFRDGFIDGYGINAGAAYDKAAAQAAGTTPQGPKVINMPPKS
jgi:hypothetical protein